MARGHAVQVLELRPHITMRGLKGGVGDDHLGLEAGGGLDGPHAGLGDPELRPETAGVVSVTPRPHAQRPEQAHKDGGDGVIG
jgi:hypothetical protein